MKKSDLFRLNDILHLPETISAWTVSLKIARTFKGGVPDVGYQGIIFATSPKEGSVVANLNRLYCDANFLAAVEANRSAIEKYGDGIVRYKNNQCEVVLHIETIQVTDIVELGGYSSTREELATMYTNLIHGRDPTAADIQDFDSLVGMADPELIGPSWIGGDAKDRVLKKIKSVMPTLRTIKQLQADAQDKR
ncbi:hypothetical protein [Limobrevibacterium gyesilva]|uniref:Uncharacterized protein n=1 Tax=Limobrevibacterium gyesilva TaxID=2991712 RepID=A0AA41YQA0_9PROT|nr:hypothetical protein [Limobrevibacterium gyesilva]MCW3476308.1 hypothetical protein [Limobrevibacterium gyesilva]